MDKNTLTFIIIVIAMAHQHRRERRNIEDETFIDSTDDSWDVMRFQTWDDMWVSRNCGKCTEGVGWIGILDVLFSHPKYLP